VLYLQLNLLLSLSCYKLACHFFLHLLSSNHKSTHPCCNATQKTEMTWTTMMKISFRGLRCPQWVACGVGWIVPLLLDERVNIVFFVKTIPM
jgi:hypothetical protein